MFLRKLFPGQIYIIICQFQSIHDVVLTCAIEYRSGNVESKSLCGQTQMNLQDLSDIHTGRYTQRIQHDIQRTTVWQEWHIFYRQNPGSPGPSGPAAGSTLTPVRACQPSGILESTA